MKREFFSEQISRVVSELKESRSPSGGKISLIAIDPISKLNGDFLEKKNRFLSAGDISNQLKSPEANSWSQTVDIEEFSQLLLQQSQQEESLLIEMSETLEKFSKLVEAISKSAQLLQKTTQALLKTPLNSFLKEFHATGGQKAGELLMKLDQVLTKTSFGASKETSVLSVFNDYRKLVLDIEEVLGEFAKAKKSIQKILIKGETEMVFDETKLDSRSFCSLGEGKTKKGLRIQDVLRDTPTWGSRCISLHPFEPQRALVLSISGQLVYLDTGLIDQSKLTKMSVPDCRSLVKYSIDFKMKPSVLNSVSFSNDGRFFAVAESETASIHVCDELNGEIIQSWTNIHEFPITRLLYFFKKCQKPQEPNEKASGFVALGYKDGTVHLLDTVLDDCDEQTAIEPERGIYAMALAVRDSANEIICGDLQGNIFGISLEAASKGDVIWEKNAIHEGMITSIAFSAKENLIVTIGRHDSSLVMTSRLNLEVLRKVQVENNGTLGTLFMSPCENFLMVHMARRILVMNMKGKILSQVDSSEIKGQMIQGVGVNWPTLTCWCLTHNGDLNQLFLPSQTS